VNYGFEVSCRCTAAPTEHTCFRGAARTEVEGADREMAPSLQIRATSAVRDRLADDRKHILTHCVNFTNNGSHQACERDVFENCCGAGFEARISVPKLNIVSAMQSNSVSETFSSMASIRMASEDVTGVTGWEGRVKH